MPKGPKGQKRPAGVIENAVRVMQIATGQVDDSLPTESNRAKAGKSGGRRRANALSSERRSEIAKKAAIARHK